MDENFGRGAKAIALGEGGDLPGPGDMIDRRGYFEFALARQGLSKSAHKLSELHPEGKQNSVTLEAIGAVRILSCKLARRG